MEITEITFTNKNGKSFSISKSRDNSKDKSWLVDEEGRGGDFKSEEIYNAIYEGLKKYFEENY